MRRHCLVTFGNRCAAAEVPVQPHKVCIFGMSNEQVLCIIHLCSIFHVQEQESGFLNLLGGLSEPEGLLPQCGTPLQVSQWDPICRNVCFCVFLCMSYVNMCVYGHSDVSA